MSETGIIGGGISGLCAAWYLVGEGRQSVDHADRRRVAESG